jgi:hypothetical protein
MSGTADPGWYDDGTGRHRWWDGTRWTGDHVDLNERTIRVQTDAVTSAPTAPAGWFDDGHGRRRWWDGHQWTTNVLQSDDAREYGGITVDGRWIHFGAHSVPVKDVAASVATVGEISKRRALSDAVTRRTLFGPAGAMRPGQFGRLDRRLAYIAVEAAPALWLTPVFANDLPRAQQFATWINTCAQHYRYR